MFFLHALATRRKELTEQGDYEALKALPRVTAFERSFAPGGVWRSDRGNNGNTTSSSTNMYEGLWTNGPKEQMEFSDYTYDDHFKSPLPAYLPRQQVLEYIMARVTQHEDIFEHVHFDTTVQSVSYDDSTKQFIVKSQHLDGRTTTQYFDKCIWASGLHGVAKEVPQLEAKLSNFRGQIVHSSQMNNIGASVKGKRILLVGGSYSAEDLALQCIKLGAEKIYITSRNDEDVIRWTRSWPSDKVDVLWERVPCGTIDGTTIQVCESKHDYQPTLRVEEGKYLFKKATFIFAPL